MLKNNVFEVPAPSSKELQQYVEFIPKLEIIAGPDEYNKALLDYKDLGDISKRLKAKKDLVLAPLKEAVKNLNGLFKPYEDTVKNAEMTLQLCLNNYLTEVTERKRLAMEKIENDKRLKNPTTIQNKIHQAGSDVPDSNTFRIKVVKVVDPTLIPFEYLEIIEAKILKTFKEGGTVPGVEIVEEVRVRR